MTERITGIPMHTARGVIYDDEPPHVDRYGLEKIDALYSRIEAMLPDATTNKHITDLETVLVGLEQIVRRYESMWTK